MNSTQYIAQYIAKSLNDTDMLPLASAWVRVGKCRVYFKLKDRSAKAYIEIDPNIGETDDFFHGCSLKVWIDEGNGNEARSSRIARAKQIKWNLMQSLHEAALSKKIVSYVLEQPICSDWHDVIL